MTDELLQRYSAATTPHDVTVGDAVMILDQPSDPLPRIEMEPDNASLFPVGRVIQINKRGDAYIIHVRIRWVEWNDYGQDSEKEATRVLVTPPDTFRVLRKINEQEVWVGDPCERLDKSVVDCCGGEQGCSCCRQVCTNCCSSSINYY